jgi:hypothetical protein
MSVPTAQVLAETVVTETDALVQFFASDESAKPSGQAAGVASGEASEF